MTSNALEKPRRPLPIAIFNGLGRSLARVGLRSSLDPDTLVAEARRKTGLQDFGRGSESEWFREPLRVLTDSLEHEAKLTPLGRMIQRGRLVSALSTRLRAAALLREHPEILDVELGPVLVIAGLQRTGTTMLHRLIASDPDTRSLLSWEALNPLPLPGEAPGRPTARVRQARIAERGLAYLAPDFFAIHPVEHDAPEEDVLLLDLCFMSQAPEATLYVPTYAAWLEKQDHRPAYAYLRQMMQILLWLQPARHWVLKSPHHMEYLGVLLEVLPEARIIQTHRDPLKTLASFCSMVSHARGVFSDDVDPHEVARHWLRKVRLLIERAIEARERFGEEHFIDVSYYDLLADPIAELARIYEFAGIPFPDRARQAAQQARARNVQHKYGRHHYRLEDFGLSPEIIECELGFYRERHHIPHEQSRKEE